MKNLKSKKVKAVEEWELVDQEEWAIKAANQFRKGAKYCPVYVFQNTKTAEIKMFAKYEAERIGIDNLHFNPLQKKGKR